MKEEVYDYLVIGQGLAGTALAVHLLGKNRRILIIDSLDLDSSSRAAAGIFNPITGRRWVTTWNANEIFGYFPKFYQDLERKMGGKFFYDFPVFRSFQNKHEQNDWLSKPAEEISPFVSKVSNPGHYDEFIHDPFGGLLLSKSGFLDTTAYLDIMRRYFIGQNCLKEEKVDLKEVRWESPFRVNDYQAEKLILCMGFGGTSQTPFGEKPFNPVKGEMLTARLSSNLPEIIFNGPVFILPQGKEMVKIGATYDFHNRSLNTTTEAREKLARKARHYLKSEFEIMDQIAGIRPSSMDRRPVVGEHPEIHNLGILNGLGTKGVSLAPLMAKLLIEKFENGKELDREIDIKRFFN